MKKRFLVLTASLLMAFSVTFANANTPVPDAIVSALHQEFKQVDDVQWKTTDNFYKASFNINGNPVEAFYSFDGQLIGVSRKLNVDQLPLSLIKEAKEKSTSSQITDLFELLTDRGTEYFITYSNDKETKIFKSSGQSWSRYN